MSRLFVVNFQWKSGMAKGLQTQQVENPIRCLALAVIEDAVRHPKYAVNPLYEKGQKVSFENLFWLLDPRTRDTWFEVAGVDFYALRKKLMGEYTFGLLLDIIEKNLEKAEDYEDRLVELEVPVQQMLDERRKARKSKKIPYWKQKQNGG